MSDQPDIYRAYAPFYDGSGQIRFAVLMGQYLLGELLPRHPVAGRRALDLACGTGTLALMLAEAGWSVVGVDRSPEMLDIARERAAGSAVARQLAFVEADMRSLPGELAASFDLVTCTYDSLNYMLDEVSLAACFRSAARALEARGLLIADMNTRHFLEHDWGEYEVIERPGFVQVSRSSFEPASASSTMHLTGFVGDDVGGYLRFDETHIERAYAPEVVAALIEQSGLRVEASYDCFTSLPPGERTQRIVWVARRAEVQP